MLQARGARGAHAADGQLRRGTGRDGLAPMHRAAERPRWRHRLEHRVPREEGDHLGALAQLRLELEAAAMQLHEVLDDRQTKAGSALGGLVRERALAESQHDFWYLVLRNARAVVAHAEEMAAVTAAADA